MASSSHATSYSHSSQPSFEQTLSQIGRRERSLFPLLKRIYLIPNLPESLRGLTFPELLLYHPGPKDHSIEEGDLVFAPLKEAIKNLERYQEIDPLLGELRLIYSDYMERACSTQGKARRQLLKGEVRLLTFINRESNCFILTPNEDKLLSYQCGEKVSRFGKSVLFVSTSLAQHSEIDIRESGTLTFHSLYELIQSQEGRALSLFFVIGKKRIFEKFSLINGATPLNLAFGHLNFGDSRRAIELFEFILPALKQEIDDSQPNADIVQILNGLGDAHKHLGNLRQAVKNYQLALSACEGYCGFHPGLGSTLNKLALAYSDLGEFEEAYRLSHQAKSIYIKIHSDQPHVDHAFALADLATICQSSGEFEEGLEYWDSALSILNQTDETSSHSKLRATLINLSFSYFSSGGIEAEEMGECWKTLGTTLSILRQLDSDALPSVLVEAIIRHCFKEFSSGRVKRVAQNCQLALSRLKQVHKDHPHPDVAAALLALGVTDISIGEWKQGQEKLLSSLEIFKKIYGDRSHPLCAIIAKILGPISLILENQVERIDLHLSLLSNYKSIHNDRPHSDIAEALISLGNAYKSLGEPSQAIEHYNSALSMFNKIYQHNPYRLAQSVLDLGIIYSELGNAQKAVECCKSALELQQLLHGDRAHNDVAKTLNYLGLAYYLSGDKEQAIRCCESSLKIYSDIYPEDRRCHPNFAITSTLTILFECAYTEPLVDIYSNYLYSKLEMFGDTVDFEKISTTPPPLSLRHLETSYLRLRKPARMIDLAETSLTAKRELHGDIPHLDTACALTELGNSYLLFHDRWNQVVALFGPYNSSSFYLNAQNKAIQHFEAALLIYRQVHGDIPHLDTANVLRNLGAAYYEDSNPDRAMEYFERSLSMRRELQEDYPSLDLAKMLHQMGTACCDIFSSISVRSVDYFEQSLAIRRTVCGDSPSFELINLHYRLGNYYHRMDVENYQRAIEHYEAALLMQKEIYGSAFTLSTLKLFCKTLEELKFSYNRLSSNRSLGEKIDCYKKLLETQRTIGDPAFFEIVETLSLIGEKYVGLGDCNQAIEYLSLSVSTWRQRCGDQPNPDVAKTLRLLGKLHLRSATYIPAIEYLNSALIMYEHFHRGQPHLDLADTLFSLGRSYYSMNDFNQAIERLKSALAIYQQIHGDQPHSNFAKLFSLLGALYLKSDEYAQSIECYNRLLTVQQQIYRGIPHRKIAQTLGILGQLYSISNNSEQAIEFLRNSHIMLLETVGPEDQETITTREWLNSEIQERDRTAAAKSSCLIS